VLNAERQSAMEETVDFTGKIALITGAGNGIGRAAALGFASRGAKVVVVDRDTAGGEATAGIIRQQGGEARFVAADVTKSAEVQNYVKATLDAYGAIDCFFNNAGIEGSVAPTAEYDEEMFDRVMTVNVKGVFLGLRHVLPVMLAQKSGAIVNTASTAGVVGTPRMPAYTASKHGVLGLTKLAAKEYAAHKIRVNAICPGVTDTPMMAGFIGGDPAIEKMMNDTLPFGRMGRPEEQAEAAVWLCSDAASFVSGESMLVDGASVCR